MPRGSKRSNAKRNKFREINGNVDNSLFFPHGLSKSTIGTNRFSPFQRSASRRDSRSSEDSIVLTTKNFRPLRHEAQRRGSTSSEEVIDSTTGHVAIEPELSQIKTQLANETITTEEPGLLNEKSASIIQNGINYLMLPFQLLHSCVFGTNAMPTETTTDAMKNLSINDDMVKNPRDVEGEAKKREVSATISREEDFSRDSLLADARREKENGSGSASSIVRGERETPTGKVYAESRRHREERPLVSSSGSGGDRGVSSTQVSSNYEKSTDDESVDEMFTAAEDSDSSNEPWTLASSVMNMSIDSDVPNDRPGYDSSSREEEPMDISIDELDVKSSTFRSPGDVRSGDSSKTTSTSSLASYSEESYSSVDDEIARIFQRKCYSSSDESSCGTASRYKDDVKSSRRDEPAKESRVDSRKAKEESVRDDKRHARNARSRSIETRRSLVRADEEQKSNASGDETRGKKISRRSEDREEKESEVSYVEGSSKRRKLSRDSKTPVKSLSSSPKSSKKSSHGSKTSSKGAQTPSKSSQTSSRSSQTSSRSSQTPSKSSRTAGKGSPPKERRSTQKEVRSRSIATQTSTAYVTDAPEIIFHRTNVCYLQQPCCRYFGRNPRMLMYPPEEMDQDLDYVADNEDSNDGSVDFARNGYSSGSLSPKSLTDQCYEEPTRDSPTQTKETNTTSWDVWLDRCGHASRTPPGFSRPSQQQTGTPRNQCGCGHPYCYILSSLMPEGQCAYGLTTHIYPRAPTPMRHMYYNFPEFMMPNTKSNAQRNNFLVPYSVDLRDCFEKELPTIMNLQPQA